MSEIILKNNNQKAVHKLSIRYTKASKGRNIIAIFAIALTTMMFTSLFTIGSGLIEVQQQQTMRQVGTSAHGSFKYLTWEEYEKLKVHPSIKSYGTTIFVAQGKNPELSKIRTEVRWGDETWAELGFNVPEHGSLPASEGKEIATSTIVLDALGIPHEIGEDVYLEFDLKGKSYQEHFTLSGFWEGDPVMGAQSLLLSRGYIDQILTVSTQNYYEQKESDPACTIGLDVVFQSPTNVEYKLQNVLTDSGYSTDQIPLGVNWAYLGSGSLDLAAFLMVFLVSLLIGGAGYLIIDNIFTISVTKDIRNYGLLKTLGTTPLQLKRLIRYQVLLLSAAGIPSGIIAGYALGYLLLPISLAITSYAGFSIPLKLNLSIILGSAFFSLLTVWLSCHKPCKLASCVSPIEALRTHETSSSKKQKRRRGRVSVLRMAWHNVVRSKKRVASVVLSLTLSIVLLNSVYGATKSFDIDKYMAKKIFTDFSVAQSAMITLFELTYLDPQVITDLSDLPGVINASPTYMQEYSLPADQKILDAVTELVAAKPDISPKLMDSLVSKAKNDGLNVHLYGVDRFVYELLSFHSEMPSWDEFSKGNTVLASRMGRDLLDSEITVYETGDTISLTSTTGNEVTYTVSATADIPYPASPMHGHINDIEIFLPMDEYLDHFMTDSLIYLHLKAEPAAIPALEKTLSDYCSSRTTSYLSRATYMAEFKQTEQTYLLVGGVLSGILGLVGILNFVNSIITSILTRRHELAMLQSVGMTTKQLRCMLMGEGFFYLILTAALTLSAGNLVSAFLTYAIAGEMWFFTYHFTMLPMLFCLPLLVIPALLIPLFSYRSVRRQSVVERLRES